MSGRKSTKKLFWFEVFNDFEKKHGNRYDYKYLEEDYKKCKYIHEIQHLLKGYTMLHFEIMDKKRSSTQMV